MRIGKLSGVMLIIVTLALSVAMVASGQEQIRVLLGSHMDYLFDAAEVFEEEFGIAVDIELVTSTDLRTKLVSSFIARRSPWDAVFLTATLVQELAGRGWIADLSERADALWGPDKEGLVLGSFEAGEFEGKSYSIPITIGAPILIWNKQLMERVGLDPDAPYEWHKNPSSYEEFIEYAKAMTFDEDGVEYYGYVDAWAGVNHARFQFMYEVQARGGDVIADDGTLLLTSDACVEALQAMYDLYNVHKVIDPAAVTYTWVFDSAAPFWDGTRGMIFTWPFVVGLSMDPDTSAFPDDVGWAPMPAVKTSASTDGSEFLGVPTLAQKPDLGWEFIAFAASYEMQKIQGMTSGWIPIWEDLLVDPDVVANQPQAPAILEVYQYPTSTYMTADYTEWTSILQAEILNAVMGRKTPLRALQDAEREIERVRN